MNIMTSSDSAVITNAGARSTAFKIRGSALSVLTSYTANGAAIIIDDISLEDKDIALPVVATDNVRVLFRFGQDFGTVVISGRAYLGAPACGNKRILGVIQSAFDSARLSKSKKPTKVSVAGSKAYPVYPVSMKISNTQAATNSVGFSIICLLAPPSA